MVEYIEREVAFNAILNLAPKVDDDGYCWVIRGDVAKAIDSIPAADVQSIVRCKDCKYCLQVDEFEYWCNGFCNPARLVRADDFCSHGFYVSGKEA